MYGFGQPYKYIVTICDIQQTLSQKQQDVKHNWGVVYHCLRSSFLSFLKVQGEAPA